MTENPTPAIVYAGLIRRLMAIIYDLFLLLALLFVTTAIIMIFNHGIAIEPGQPLYPFYVACLVIISFFFFF